MGNNKLFSSFDYTVRNLPIYRNKARVKVFFTFKNEHVITKSLFFKKLENKNESYYIDEAKLIIEKMIKNGSLRKECEEKIMRKKLLPILIPIASVVAITGITLGCYYGLKPQPHPQEIRVEVPEINGLVFKNQNAYLGHDYDTEISVNKTLTDLILPTELKSVTSGNRVLLTNEYIYNVAVDYKTAQFHIPGKYIEGDIKIDLELESPIPPVPHELLTIEYEYNDTTTDNQTVGFLIANQDGSEVTFDWGDGSEIETVTPSTDLEEMYDYPVTHQYTSAPQTGDTYTITVSGDLAVFLASAKDWEGSDNNVVIKKGNFYFKSATLYKNFGTIDLMSNEAYSMCALGGLYEDSGDSGYSNISQISFGDEVTVIPPCLMELSKIESVTIPNQITSIGFDAFDECPELSNVIFAEGSSLETIGTRSFYYCDNLRTITIPRTVKTIEENAFNNCPNLWNINLHEFNEGDDVPTIEANSFENNSYAYFVTKSDEVAQKFQNAWQSTLTNTGFVRGASMVFEDTTDGGDGYTFSALGGDLYMDESSLGPRFFFHDTNDSRPNLTTLHITNNLNKQMEVKRGGEAFDFVISNEYYEEGLIWIKVTYQPQ